MSRPVCSKCESTGVYVKSFWNVPREEYLPVAGDFGHCMDCGHTGRFAWRDTHGAVHRERDA